MKFRWFSVFPMITQHYYFCLVPWESNSICFALFPTLFFFPSASRVYALLLLPLHFPPHSISKGSAAPLGGWKYCLSRPHLFRRYHGRGPVTTPTGLLSAPSRARCLTSTLTYCSTGTLGQWRPRPDSYHRVRHSPSKISDELWFKNMNYKVWGKICSKFPLWKKKKSWHSTDNTPSTQQKVKNYWTILHIVNISSVIKQSLAHEAQRLRTLIRIWL